MTSLIQIHIGKQLPNYIYDSLYQSLLINDQLVTIYVLIDSTLIKTFNERIHQFNINSDCIKAVPLNNKSDKIIKYTEYMKKFPRESMAFRDSFWISTTARFFYIEEFMRKEKLTNVFHIENDVMLYEDLNNIMKTLNRDKMYMVQDNVARVVPSILFIPNVTQLDLLNNFILNQIKNSSVFLNDMNLLGLYKDKEAFPFHFNTNSKYIFDGAAIGQYLGGVDPNNLPKKNTDRQEELKRINNPSKYFINETSDFKVNDTITFFRKNIVLKKNLELDLIYAKEELPNNQIKLKQICNLHIHSKQLYQFSSVFDIKYNDIITGDRVLNLCDFIISTPEIYQYHQNSGIDPDKFILIQNFQNINVNALIQCFDKSKSVISLFIYTHILDYFIEYILDILPKNIKFIIYLHNSDHSLNSTSTSNHIKLINNKCIIKIYSQNIDFSKNTTTNSSKINTLPIGLANNMFNKAHGDILSLYKCMGETYKNSKNNSIYININPNTYQYRKYFVDYCNQNGIKTTKSNKPFTEYLYDLSTHYFCLALRGNGLDTHRFWESLYLNVIPVIINNKYTNMSSYIDYLHDLSIPFFEIKEDDIDIIVNKYFKSDFFNKELYFKLTKGKPINTNDSLKINNYC